MICTNFAGTVVTKDNFWTVPLQAIHHTSCKMSQAEPLIPSCLGNHAKHYTFKLLYNLGLTSTKKDTSVDETKQCWSFKGVLPPMFGQGGTIFRKATVQQIMHILGASAPECCPKQNIAGYENNGSIQQTSKKNICVSFFGFVIYVPCFA
jgi:hypothetical protein